MTDSKVGDWRKITDALKAANVEYCAISWSGFNLLGDKASIEEVTRLQHEVERLNELVSRGR